jgi:ribosomal protein S18 acetylase RimI-like enzyme
VAAANNAQITLLPRAAAGDSSVMVRLAKLINVVYAEAEAGLWTDGVARTTAAEVTGIVRAGQFGVAQASGQILGCVRVQLPEDGVAELGMLAVDPEQRGTGLGRDLVRFAERAARERQCVTMRLEVLVPREWTHPSKEFLIGWYSRIGYRYYRTDAIEECYPRLVPLLATPCDFVIYRKDLGTSFVAG